MSAYSDSIIVPYDFTEKADFAVKHAAIMAKNMNAEVILLHIVKKEDQSSEAEGKLEEIAAKHTSNLGVNVRHVTREGTIFKTINEVVEEMKSVCVVMGTHGMKGMQKITGSWALKVIVGCHVPYLIVQKEPEYHEVADILFPVDYKLETKEKLKWVSMLSYISKIKVSLLGQQGNGPMYDTPTKANMNFCKKYLAEREIEYEVVWLDQKGSFYELSLKYAKEHNSDIVMITTTRDIAFHDYILGAYEQHVIANEYGIPVFVVNPRSEVKLAYQNF
ncbi:MAG: universal stress protein [Bacteroidales bacterium]|nr:universal stress protein [Bacteroidales bacterium]